MTDSQNSQIKINTWWIYLLNGSLLTILGIIMLKMPRESMSTMLLIMGIVVLLVGLLESFLAIYYRNVVFEWVWALAGGLLDVIIGLFLIANPKAILLIITFFVSFWLVIRGVTTIRDALKQQNEGSNRWKLTLVFGVALLLLAIVLIWHPHILGITLVFWLAISFITLGILRIVLAFRLQGLSRS